MASAATHCSPDALGCTSHPGCVWRRAGGQEHHRLGQHSRLVVPPGEPLCAGRGRAGQGGSRPVRSAADSLLRDTCNVALLVFRLASCKVLLAGDAVSAGCLSTSKCIRLVKVAHTTKVHLPQPAVTADVCVCICVLRDTRESITDVVCVRVHRLRLEATRLPACFITPPCLRLPAVTRVCRMSCT